MSSFGAATFQVIPEDRRWPLPARDADGTARYRADVQCTSATAYAALVDQQSWVTVKRALGSFAAAVLVEAGPGSAILTVPTRAGVSQPFTAVLVSVQPTASGDVTERYRATCEWIVLSDITP